VLDVVRKEAENCDCLQGWFLFGILKCSLLLPFDQKACC
jgi:hypothetical protein